MIGALTFDPGQTTKTIPVVVHSRRAGRGQRDVLPRTLPARRTQRSPTARGSGRSTTTTRRPRCRSNDATVIEGNTGTVPATFTVTLSAPSGRNVTVDYATANGTAVAPGDYAVASGVLTFAAGETTKTVNVQVNGDVLNEAERRTSSSISRTRRTRRSPTTRASARSPRTTARRRSRSTTRRFRRTTPRGRTSPSA